MAEQDTQRSGHERPLPPAQVGHPPDDRKSQATTEDQIGIPNRNEAETVEYFDSGDADQDDGEDDEDFPTLEEIQDSADLESASITFFEDLSKGATTRSRNVPADQKQRPIVTSRGTRSLRYKSTVELATCVHGYLDARATPAIPATLIVL